MGFFALKTWVRTPKDQGNVGFHGSVCVFSLEIMPAFKRKQWAIRRSQQGWRLSGGRVKLYVNFVHREFPWRLHECRSVVKKNLVCGLWWQLHIKYTWQQLSIDVSQTMLIWCMSVILVSLTIVGYMTSPWYFLGCFLMEETHDKNFMGSPSHEKMFFFRCETKGLQNTPDHYLGGGFKYFYFHPYLGKWSNLTNIFQMGWNHQLDYVRNLKFDSWKEASLNQSAVFHEMI